MKIAYLILAHKNPEQLARLISRLSTTDAIFYIHIDKKVPFYPFRDALKDLPAAKIRFVKRENSNWGTFGMVQASINGIKQIVGDSANEKFDYLILLSGQDYPLKSTVFINNFFEKNYGKNFVYYSPIPTSDFNWGARGGLERIDKYYVTLPFARVSFIYPNCKGYPSIDDITKNKIKRRIIYAVVRLFFSKPRKFPAYLKPYGGSQWFSITLHAAKYITDFLKEHPDYAKFHKYSFVRDEIFFHTILLNSKDDKLKDNILCDNLVYLEGTRILGGPFFKTGDNVFHIYYKVKILQEENFNSLINSDKLFGRKFDIKVDSKILDKIDENINFNRK